MGGYKGRQIRRFFLSVSTHWIAFLVAIFFTSVTMANPILNNVAAGNATVNQTATTTTVNQTSQKAILNWQSFNIGAGEHTHFNQPANGVALNRISASQGASQIYGHLSATGQIILVNPAGVHFGPGSFVNVGGIIATTANISNTDFLNGYYNFSQPSSISGAAITNAGHIVAASHGLVALVGGNVTNSGHIQANLGKVVLASGNTFTMSFDGSNLIHFAVNSAGSGVSNTGTVMADGGSILVTAQTASGVLDNVINLEGVLQAKTIDEDYGDIVIAGDPGHGVVRIAAAIDADGGNINITGYDILLAENAKIDVGNGNAILFAEHALNAYGTIQAAGGFVETSSKGILNLNNITVKSDTWLIDPVDLEVNLTETPIGPGATVLTETFVENALADNNVIIATTPGAGPGLGNITVNATIDWATTNFLKLVSVADIILNNPINGTAGSFMMEAMGNIISNGSAAINVAMLSAQAHMHHYNAPILAANSAEFIGQGGGAQIHINAGLITGDLRMSGGTIGPPPPPQNGYPATGQYTFAISGPLTISNPGSFFESNSGIFALSGMNNTLMLNTEGAQRFNINGTDAGSFQTAGTAAAIPFTNIQNLTGGNVNNTFVFSSGSILTGALNGGLLLPGDGPRNTIDISSYPSGATINLIETIFNGDLFISGNKIVSFANINQIRGHEGAINTINLPSGKATSVDYTNFRFGSIGDPLFFINLVVNGFNTPPPTAINTATNTPIIKKRGYSIGSDVDLLGLLAKIFVNDKYNPFYDGKEIFIYPQCLKYTEL